MIKYGKHYLDVGFSAEIVAGEPQIIEPHKIEVVEWFDLNKLPEPLFEPVRVAVEAYKGGEIYWETRE